MLVTVLASLNGCATAGGGVTEVEPCVEIPFLDGPEGACTNTVKHQAYLVPADKWKEERKLMIMIRARDWTKIKLDWMRACRMPGVPKSCAVALSSVDSAMQALNKIVEGAFK